MSYTVFEVKTNTNIKMFVMNQQSADVVNNNFLYGPRTIGL